MKRCIALFLLFLAACQGDETLRAYGGDKTWVLTEIDGTAFKARATLSFPEAGSLAGDAPCNSYFGAMTTPYPWFKAENVASTRMACPDLDAETLYLTALSEMTLAEVSGDTLLLTNEAGRSLLFRAQ